MVFARNIPKHFDTSSLVHAKAQYFSFLFMETRFSASLVFSLASLYWALLSEHIFIGTLKTVFMGQLLESGISLLVIKFWEQNLIWWIAGHRHGASAELHGKVGVALDRSCGFRINPL